MPEELWSSWLDFKKSVKDNKNAFGDEEKAINLVFKEFLNKKVVEQIKKKNPIDKMTSQDDVEIANISFAYDNRIIMDLLKKRT